MDGKIVINMENGLLIASNTEYANNWLSRLIGLLSRDSINTGEGLLITPCHSIHTLGMKFTIDVVFLDSENRIIRLVEELKPNRICLACKEGRSVLELPIGTIKKAVLKKGDRLQIIL